MLRMGGHHQLVQRLDINTRNVIATLILRNFSSFICLYQERHSITLCQIHLIPFIFGSRLAAATFN